MANLGSWEQDLESGEIELSEDARRIFGMPPEASRTTMETLFSLVHPDDQISVRETIKNAPAQRVCSQIDYRIILPDGTERFLRQYIEPLGNEAGRGRLLGTVQDVTEYKHLEEKFRRAQRLEGIARLAGGVAHDFNNLLLVINGYAWMILEKLKAEDPLRYQAQEIINAGNRAAALTRQLLAFSRKQVMRPRVIDLNRLLADFEKMLRRLIREDIEVKQNLPRTLEGESRPRPGRAGHHEPGCECPRRYAEGRGADDWHGKRRTRGTGGQRILGPEAGTVRVTDSLRHGNRHDSRDQTAPV
jgi:PAS domain S-box-containing protein